MNSTVREKIDSGSLVRIECDNKQLNGKIGTLLLDDEPNGPVYGVCVMIDGVVYGFEKNEVSALKN